tara:strand:- start:7593 stop:8072 length:480 start_codon:yes stop_codon:yes gene_type:complete
MTTAAMATLLLTLTGCGSGAEPAEQAAQETVTKTTDGYEITLSNVYVGDSVDETGMVPDAGEGEVYVLITYDLSNSGNAQTSLADWPEVFLLDADGNEYQRELFASTALSAVDDPSWAEGLSPGLSTTAKAIWKVSESRFDRNAWRVKFNSTPELIFEL